MATVIVRLAKASLFALFVSSQVNSDGAGTAVGTITNAGGSSVPSAGTELQDGLRQEQNNSRVNEDASMAVSEEASEIKEPTKQSEAKRLRGSEEEQTQPVEKVEASKIESTSASKVYVEESTHEQSKSESASSADDYSNDQGFTPETTANNGTPAHSTDKEAASIPQVIDEGVAGNKSETNVGLETNRNQSSELGSASDDSKAVMPNTSAEVTDGGTETEEGGIGSSLQSNSSQALNATNTTLKAEDDLLSDVTLSNNTQSEIPTDRGVPLHEAGKEVKAPNSTAPVNETISSSSGVVVVENQTVRDPALLVNSTSEEMGNNQAGEELNENENHDEADLLSVGSPDEGTGVAPVDTNSDVNDDDEEEAKVTPKEESKPRDDTTEAENQSEDSGDLGESTDASNDDAINDVEESEDTGIDANDGDAPKEESTVGDDPIDAGNDSKDFGENEYDDMNGDDGNVVDEKLSKTDGDSDILDEDKFGDISHDNDKNEDEDEDDPLNDGKVEDDETFDAGSDANNNLGDDEFGDANQAENLDNDPNSAVDVDQNIEDDSTDSNVDFRDNNEDEDEDVDTAKDNAEENDFLEDRDANDVDDYEIVKKEYSKAKQDEYGLDGVDIADKNRGVGVEAAAEDKFDADALADVDNTSAEQEEQDAPPASEAHAVYSYDQDSSSSNSSFGMMILPLLFLGGFIYGTYRCSKYLAAEDSEGYSTVPQVDSTWRRKSQQKEGGIPITPDVVRLN